VDFSVMGMALFDFFTDPVLRAPTIACMLMGLSSSLIGVLVFLQRRSLLGEALAHAAYPGVALSGLFLSYFAFNSEKLFSLSVLLGALGTVILALGLIQFLEKKCAIKADSALCFTLSLFFGIGVLLASRLQLSHPLWYKQIQVFLYGQAATMTDAHIVFYALLTGLVALLIFLFFRPISLIHFDRNLAQLAGLNPRWLQFLLLFLLGLALVVGMRSVGLVLISSLLIAPASGARQLCRHLSTFFIVAGFLGMISGFLGNYLAVQIPVWLNVPKLSLPTGPMIALAATALCLLCLFFSPGRGYVVRELRLVSFKMRCSQENRMKQLYKAGGSLALPFSWSLWRMRRKKWIVPIEKGVVQLTPEGEKIAAKIVRLHRLWEVYLVHMGQGSEKVHRSAEEMEHILTPETEKELGELLKHPRHDPHQQVIPR
jgi:manganese/zinc/iron transport system permease protein